MRWIPELAVLLLACNAQEDPDEVLLAGTVRWDQESEEPVDRAFVRVTDANKSQRCFVTACDGTFTVRRGDLAFLTMPLTAVSVERVDRPEATRSSATSLVMRRMDGRVGRERNCNGCHAHGVPLFPSASAVPPEMRTPSATCAPGAIEVAMQCPEDRPIPNDELQFARDFATYSSSVHDVLARRCGSLDCHGGTELGLRIDGDRAASFASVMAQDPTTLMTKARGGAGHGGGRLIFVADPADQCVADWLGVPRDTSEPASSEKLTHADACALAASVP